MTASPNLDARVQQTFLLEDRDWLQFSVMGPGAAQIQLLAGGHPVAVLPVVPVEPAAIQRLRLLGEDEFGARKDQWLVVLAQAYEDAGRAIYGMEYQWDVDGQAAQGMGDIYRYKYDPGRPRDLSARFGGGEARAPIHSSQGYVDSTNHLGCSMAPRAQPGSAALLLAIAALLGRRRSPS